MTIFVVSRWRWHQCRWVNLHHQAHPPQSPTSHVHCSTAGRWPAPGRGLPPALTVATLGPVGADRAQPGGTIEPDDMTGVTRAEPRGPSTIWSNSPGPGRRPRQRDQAADRSPCRWAGCTSTTSMSAAASVGAELSVARPELCIRHQGRLRPIHRRPMPSPLGPPPGPGAAPAPAGPGPGRPVGRTGPARLR